MDIKSIRADFYSYVCLGVSIFVMGQALFSLFSRCFAAAPVKTPKPLAPARVTRRVELTPELGDGQSSKSVVDSQVTVERAPEPVGSQPIRSASTLVKGGGLARALAFYRGKIPTNTGVKLEELVQKSNDWLEAKHDYIQWLFPIDTRSRFNPDAPVINKAEINCLTPEELKEMQQGLHASLIVMLKFYGLTMTSSTGQIERNLNYSTRRLIWLTSDNHNFLRLTRILNCLDLFSMQNEKRELFKILRDIYEKEGKSIIGPRTYEYWRSCVERGR